MNNLDRQYKELLQQIIHFGVEKQDRTGTGTKSIFGWQIRHNMKEGFPLLTTKKMAFKTMVTELLSSALDVEKEKHNIGINMIL